MPEVRLTAFRVADRQVLTRVVHAAEPVVLLTVAQQLPVAQVASVVQLAVMVALAV